MVLVAEHKLKMIRKYQFTTKRYLSKMQRLQKGKVSIQQMVLLYLHKLENMAMRQTLQNHLNLCFVLTATLLKPQIKRSYSSLEVLQLIYSRRQSQKVYSLKGLVSLRLKQVEMITIVVNNSKRFLVLIK